MQQLQLLLRKGKQMISLLAKTDIMSKKLRSCSNERNQDQQIILLEILIKKSNDSAQLMLITRLLLMGHLNLYPSHEFFTTGTTILQGQPHNPVIFKVPNFGFVAIEKLADCSKSSWSLRSLLNSSKLSRSSRCCWSS